MIIHLPCKLGERFTERVFKDWIDGKRVYYDGQERPLNGFSAFTCNTRCLEIPRMYTDGPFLSYDHTGEFGQQFIPKYKIDVPIISTSYKLSDLGFPSGKKGKISGVHIENGYLIVDFVTDDRAEHLRYAIKDLIEYAGLEETPTPTLIKYDKEADEEKNKCKSYNSVIYEKSDIRTEPREKKKNLAELIKQSMKRVEFFEGGVD